jgi:hypothetical protein
LRYINSVFFSKLFEDLIDTIKKRKGLQKTDLLAYQFPDAWNETDSYQPRTLIEYQIKEIAGMIREKHDWAKKMQDPSIWAKWTEEANGTEELMNYIREELTWCAANQPGPIHKSAVDGVWFADDIVPANITADLIKGVSKLENVPDHEKDWHPGTDEQVNSISNFLLIFQVLDLVHPSLFCLVFGQTRGIENQIRPSLESIGKGRVILADNIPDRYSMSQKYQWLPSEFVVSPNGK